MRGESFEKEAMVSAGVQCMMESVEKQPKAALCSECMIQCTAAALPLPLMLPIIRPSDSRVVQCMI